MHWKGTGGRSRGCSVGFDGIKMYRMVDGFVLFIFSRAMTDILYCVQIWDLRAVKQFRHR